MKKIFRQFNISIRLILVTLVSTILCITGMGSNSLAAGSAQFSLTPATSSRDINTTFTITVKLNPSGESLNAAQADITYPTDKLELTGFTNTCTGVWTIKAQEDASGGMIHIACGATTPVTADAALSTLTFKALAGSGSAALTYATSTAAVRSSNNSDATGAKSGATVNFTTPAVTETPPPTTPPPSGTTNNSGGSTPAATTPPASTKNKPASVVTNNNQTPVTADTPVNVSAALLNDPTVTHAAITTGGVEAKKGLRIGSKPIIITTSVLGGIALIGAGLVMYSRMRAKQQWKTTHGYVTNDLDKQSASTISNLPQNPSEQPGNVIAPNQPISQDPNDPNRL